MFASIRRYRLQSGSMDEVLHLVDSDFAESIAEVDGFVAYECMDCGNGELITMSVFRDRDAAQDSEEMAAEWVRTTLAGQFDIMRLDAQVGEIAVSRAHADMLVPAHH
jgi:quinol monooxygenase YgiN